MAIAFRIVLPAVFAFCICMIACIAFIPTYFTASNATSFLADNLLENIGERLHATVLQQFIKAAAKGEEMASSLRRTLALNSISSLSDDFLRGLACDFIFGNTSSTMTPSITVFTSAFFGLHLDDRWISCTYRYNTSAAALYNKTHSTFAPTEPITFRVLPGWEPWFLFNFTTRPWFISGVQGTGWLPAYPLASGMYAAVAIATPVMENNTVIGVFAAEMRTSDITYALSQLNYGKTGIGFVFQPSNWNMIGNSWNEEVVYNDNGTKRLKTVAMAHHPLMSKIGNVASRCPVPGGPSIVTSTAGGMRSRIRIRCSDFSNANKLSLQLLIALPEEDYLSSVHANLTAVLVLVICIICLSTVGVVFLVRNLLNPFVILPQKLSAAAELERGSGPELNRTNIREVDDVIAAFETMRDQLVRIRPFIPQTIMTRRSPQPEEALSPACEQNEFSVISNPLTVSSGASADDALKLADNFLRDEDNTFKHRRCSVVYIDIPDLPTNDLHTLGSTVQSIMSKVVSCAVKCNGIVESATPSSMMISFNAHLACVVHEQRAVRFASLITDALTANSVIAIDSTDCAVGTAGGGGHRARVLIGEASDLVKKLCALSREYLGAKIVVTERIARCVNVPLIAADILAPQWLQEGREKLIMLYVLRESAATVMSEGQSAQHRKAFVSLYNGNLDYEALAALKGMEGDVHVKRLLTLSHFAPFKREENVGWNILPEEVRLAPPTAVTFPRIEEARNEVMAQLDKAANRVCAHSPDAQGGDLFPLYKSVCDEENEEPSILEDMDHVKWVLSKAPIAKGASARVYQAMSDTGARCAMKHFSLIDVDSETLRGELDAVTTLRHENIVSYVSCCVLKSDIYIMTELLPGGDLRNLCTMYGALPYNVVRRFAIEILKGLSYLHSKGIVHCDVKPQNILVTTEGIPKLTDFGSSLLALVSASSCDIFHLKGTSWYMAPEVAKGEAPTAASDMWSFAVTILEILLGGLPWTAAQRQGGNENVFICELSKKESMVPPIPEEVPPIMQKLLSKCFQRDPTNRPSANELLSSNFTLQRGKNFCCGA